MDWRFFVSIRAKRGLLITSFMCILTFLYGSSLYKNVVNVEVSHPVNAEYMENMTTVLDTQNFSNGTCLISKDEYNNKYKQLNTDIPLICLLKQNISFFPKSCAIFPDYFDLRFSNIFWQVLNLKKKSSSYFLSAYFDNRDLIGNSPVIRIISATETVDIPSVKYCQIWFPNEGKVITSKVQTLAHSYGHAIFEGLILTCEIPSRYNNTIPTAVSLVENECDLATNVLTVQYNLPKSGKKEDFAICIKALLYPYKDLSYHLVQYVELAKLLGVNKIFIYKDAIHPNMSAVLRYYENKNTVQVIQITNPENLRSTELLWTQEFNHRIHQNDCFYKNMYKYKYIASFDMDEIMIPSDGKSWKELINEVINNEKKIRGNIYEPPTAYLFPCNVFLDIKEGWAPDIPKYMSMLQNVYGTSWERYTKQLIDTDKFLFVSTHKPYECIGKCITHTFDINKALMFHFRSFYSNNKYIKVKDLRIWKHKEVMIKQVDEVLKSIGLL